MVFEPQDVEQQKFSFSAGSPDVIDMIIYSESDGNAVRKNSLMELLSGRTKKIWGGKTWKYLSLARECEKAFMSHHVASSATMMNIISCLWSRLTTPPC